MKLDNFQQRLEQMANKVLGDFNLPSLSVSVTAGGQDFHCACGMADIEGQVAATPKSIYAVGSTSKAFVATIICMLADEGKLQLDKPVKDYLPDFQMYDPYMTNHLTVRDMLCHRCGLPRYDLSMFNHDDYTTQQYVDLIRHMQPVFEPRTRFSYQNHMFMLATILCETLTGKKWNQLVQERIFAPLGMEDSYGDGSIAPDGPAKAKPYMEADGQIKRMPYNYHKYVAGAGAIYSTTQDMLKWLRFRLHGDEKILKGTLLDEMHTPHIVIKAGERGPTSFPEIDFSSYCLAWSAESYQGVKLVQHSGAIDGFRATAMFAPQKDFAVAVLTNHNSTNAMTALAYMAADAALGLEEKDWCGRYLEVQQKMEAEQAKQTEASRAKAEAAGENYGNIAGIQGKYSEAVYGDVEIAVEGGKPVLKGFGQSLVMKGGTGDLFVVFYPAFGMSLEVQLTRDSSGQINGFTMPLEPMRKDPIPFAKQ